MEEVLDHNQEAEQIFRQYGRLLELVAAAQLPGRPEDAEECVQDAVWAFVEGRAPWDPAQGSKQTWLCVLVRSRAKDRRRALAARMEEPLEEHSGLAAADHAERAAVRDGLRRVLEGLSREERRLFTLRFVYGLSSAELGGVLGLSPNGVDARVSRSSMKDIAKKECLLCLAVSLRVQAVNAPQFIQWRKEELIHQEPIILPIL